MAKRSTDAVRNGELKIVPAEHEKTWFQWLDNIRDWCVSRQLWWGHQIPAWFATKKDETEVLKMDMKNNDRWVVARSEEVRCRLNFSASVILMNTFYLTLQSYFTQLVGSIHQSRTTSWL
jgi:valyl-tRNA synthetase